MKILGEQKDGYKIKRRSAFETQATNPFVLLVGLGLLNDVLDVSWLNFRLSGLLDDRHSHLWVIDELAAGHRGHMEGDLVRGRQNLHFIFRRVGALSKTGPAVDWTALKLIFVFGEVL